MKKCPFCGADLKDDSLFCTECGKEQPKGNTCPHCGAIVNEGDVFCTECGKNIEEVVQVEEPKAIQHETTPVEVDKQERIEVDNSSSNNLKWIAPIVIGMIILVLIGGGLWYMNSSSSKKETIATAPIDSIEVVREATPQEGTDNEEGRFAAEDSGATLSITLYGKIGGDAVLEVDCNEGWYQMTYNGADKTKRKLEVVSYDISDGHLVLNAFLKGKYIGQFDGILDDSIYRGIFTSVKGARIDFKLSSD